MQLSLLATGMISVYSFRLFMYEQERPGKGRMGELIMTNRREFLQAAAVLTSAPLLNRMAFAGSGTAIALDTVIYDSRHPQAHAFAARSGQLGVILRPIEADITALWQNELHHHWQSAPAAVAGLTERPALFLLERLAWDHGLRVVFEAEHVPDGQGAAVHRVIRTGEPGLER